MVVFMGFFFVGSRDVFIDWFLVVIVGKDREFIEKEYFCLWKI